MRVCQINTTDVRGGAAIAAHRLHIGLRNIGINSRMLVSTKLGSDADIEEFPWWTNHWIQHQNLRLNRVPLKLYPNRLRTVVWSNNWVPIPIDKAIDQRKVDLFHLHWIGDGFIPVNRIRRFKKPIVWTFHDQWAITGGCHYTGDCNRYCESCGQCPQLGSTHDFDLSRYGWKCKRKAYSQVKMTIVTPSRWLASCVQSSSLLSDRRIEVIPNGIDLELYRSRDRQFVRSHLGLPLDRCLIMFGASASTVDPRKGFHLLQASLDRLSQAWRDRAELVIFGADVPEKPPEFGLRTHYLGAISDEAELAEVYSCADVFVAPSVQENLANTVMEALACGIPSVAFDIGGMPDLIDHKQNGYLARPYEVDDLARGIEWVLEDEERHAQLAASAREKVEANFEIGKIAQRYKTLYTEILQTQ